MAAKKKPQRVKRMRFEIVRCETGYFWTMYGRNGKYMSAGITTFRDPSACKLVVQTMIKHIGKAVIDGPEKD